jgi:hypothetical protein
LDDDGKLIGVHSRTDVTFLATAADAQDALSNMDVTTVGDICCSGTATQQKQKQQQQQQQQSDGGTNTIMTIDGSNDTGCYAHMSGDSFIAIHL